MDIDVDNFVDQNPSAGDAQPAPIPLFPTTPSTSNEQEPTLGPPEAKRPRLQATTTVSTLHPVSELTQKYQGAMFMLIGK